MYSYQYWNGDTLNIPGQVNEKLLTPWKFTENSTDEIKRVTKSNWRITCIDRFDNSGTRVGDGFVAHAPNGSTYTFAEIDMVAVNAEIKAGIKYQAFMKVTKIEDRFGNWVQYHYHDDSKIKDITANDGRLIEFKYEDVAHPDVISKCNALNRLSSLSGAGATGYNFSRSDSYDTRGNVTDNGKRNFNYNLANQMIDSGGNSYLYDGYNRRVKTIDSKGTSYSMYSQSGRLLYRQTEDGGVNYIFLGDKLVAKEGVMPVNTDSRLHYKPFDDSIETPKDEVGYTGHKFDTDLGLNYMQARYYDPAIGRFMSNDPIGYTGEVDTFNRYLYVANNPYKYTDPTGMFKGCASDSNCTVLIGNKKEEDESFNKALNTQISLARQARSTYSKIDSGYSDTAVGGFIDKGTSILSNNLTVEGYTLSVVNIRAADGLVPEPGMFGGSLHEVQTGSKALVVAPVRSMTLQKIQDNSAHYKHLADITKSTVYVISSGKTVYKYTQSGK